MVIGCHGDGERGLLTPRLSVGRDPRSDSELFMAASLILLMIDGSFRMNWSALESKQQHSGLSTEKIARTDPRGGG